jgi:hypothetical protein
MTGRALALRTIRSRAFSVGYPRWRATRSTASRHGSHVDVDVRLISSFISRSLGRRRPFDEGQRLLDHHRQVGRHADVQDFRNWPTAEMTAGGRGVRFLASTCRSRAHRRPPAKLEIQWDKSTGVMTSFFWGGDLPAETWIPFALSPGVMEIVGIVMAAAPC